MYCFLFSFPLVQKDAKIVFFKKKKKMVVTFEAGTTFTWILGKQAHQHPYNREKPAGISRNNKDSRVFPFRPCV